MRRISVVGTSGSGKTTFSHKLASILRFQHVELDCVNWGANWTALSPDVFRARIEEIVKADTWVIDGNYAQVRELIWESADTVVWLDYSLLVIMRRIIWRTFRRLALRETCCNGNRESLIRTFSRDSIILWALHTYQRRRGEYPAKMEVLRQRGVNTFRFRSPKNAEEWLKKMLDARC